MDAIQVIAENRKARHEYYIEDVIEAGIVLQGTEVKSVRGRRVNLKDSYAKVENNEVFLYGMHISPYEQGNRFNHDPLRVRKLLLNRSEIRRLIGITREKGMALIPLRLYFRRGLVKVELAVSRGKKLYDKRQDLAERSAQRDIERAFRERQRAE
ncbi:MAG: SsrA-binding protein SmpB [Firmicutes bacterium]|nr:SsrA-binding protein SmpB [Bacillota bacterium]